jgi:hypothetical protein
MPMCRVKLSKTKVQWTIDELYQELKCYRNVIIVLLACIITVTILFCQMYTRQAETQTKSLKCLYALQEGEQSYYQANCME